MYFVVLFFASFPFSDSKVIPNLSTFLVQIVSTILLIPLLYLIFVHLPKRFKENNRRLKQLETEVEKLKKK